MDRESVTGQAALLAPSQAGSMTSVTG